MIGKKNFNCFLGGELDRTKNRCWIIFFSFVYVNKSSCQTLGEQMEMEVSTIKNVNSRLDKPKHDKSGYSKKQVVEALRKSGLIEFS